MTSYRIPTMRTREQHTRPVVVSRAPCCGVRNIPADMLRYVGDVPREMLVRAELPLNVEYVCDGCMATVFRHGKVGHCEWHAAIGAPQEVIEMQKQYMESYPYPQDSAAFALKLAHHPHLKKEQ